MHIQSHSAMTVYPGSGLLIYKLLSVFRRKTEIEMNNPVFLCM